MKRRALRRSEIEWVVGDGVVSIRAFTPEDEPALLASRDDEWDRWLGPGDEHPQPTACILVDDRVVGWVDSDRDHPALGPGETNVGYHVFAPHRGAGYATRAVRLLIRRLAEEGDLTTAILEVHALNAASLRVAEKAGFVRTGETPDGYRFSRLIL
jgi:RimJ/RimL family protein N-acetyltransferase